MVSIDVAEEQWAFVTMTFDGSTLAFYTNAGFAGSAVIDGYSGNGYDLLIGAQDYTLDGNVPSLFWHGWIDEVKIHDRALDPIEVSRLYTTGSTITSRYVAMLSEPGNYVITNVPTKLRYHLDAWRDSDGDGATDIAEAQGIYPYNLLALDTAATNININLTEIDTDADGIPDWWEIQFGFNPSSGVAPSLVGWWKFDESTGTNADNSASTGYDGQLVNMSTSSWVSGKLGNALVFDGANDYVRVLQSPALITGHQYTASGWVNLSVSSNDDYPSIVADFNNCGGPFKGFWFGWDSSLSAVGSLVADCHYSFVYPYYSTNVSEVWAHLATTYDGSTLRIYLNGELVNSQSGAFEPAEEGELRIGWGNDPAANYFWEGMLDDIRIYSSALTSNQIATMYDALLDYDNDGLSNVAEYENGTNPTMPDTDGDSLPDAWEIAQGLNPTNTLHAALAGLWTFDDGQGTNVQNFAGSAYNGHFVNMDTNDWVAGYFGGAVELDGVDDYIQVPQSPPIITGNQFTVSGMAYLQAGFDDEYPSLVSDLAPCGIFDYTGFWLGYDSYSDKNGGLYGGCSFNYPTSAEMSITGQWVYLALTYDSTTSVLYVDGVEVNAGGGSFSPAANSELRIGWANDPNYTYNWKGKLDDVRVYTLALSSNEIINAFTNHPALLDEDGDGLGNYEELQAGTAPLNADTDGDGMPDKWELDNGFDPLDPADGPQDADMDGWSNAEEYENGTDLHDRFSAVRIARGVVINEVMYNPTGDDYGYEWVELYCAGPRPIDLGGFFLEGTLTNAPLSITPLLVFPTNMVIYPGRHLLIGGTGLSMALDVTNNFVLVNSDDRTCGLRLMAFSNLVVDALLYGYPNRYNLPTNGFGTVGPPPNRPPHTVSSHTQAIVRAVRGVDTDHAMDWTTTSDLSPHNSGVLVDTDGDGITDADELTGVSNPFGLPTSYVKYDSDGDGLSDLEEWTHGADPWEVDTDGDGLWDGAEVKEAGSNPLVADVGAVSHVVWQASGISYTNADGTWGINGDSVYGLSAGGNLYYMMTLTNSGVFALELEGAQYDTDAAIHDFLIQLKVNGQYVGQKVLHTRSAVSSVAVWMLPWLPSGEHSLELRWQYQAPGNGNLRVIKLRALAYGGVDDNENGQADWLDYRTNTVTGIQSWPTSSLVSPVCLEGCALNFDTLTLDSTYTPTNGIHVAPALRRGLSGRWYADVPLATGTNTVINLAGDNGASQKQGSIEWQELNLFDAPTNRYMVRRNDGLLVNGRPSAGNGTVEIFINQVSTYSSASNLPWSLYFTNAGVFRVAAQWTDGGPVQYSSTVTVEVISAEFSGDPAVWSGIPRAWSCPALSTNVWVEMDSEVSWTRTVHSSTGSLFSLALGQPKAYTALARIGGVGGPIISSARVRGFHQIFSTELDWDIIFYDDGSRRVLMGVLVVAEEMPDDLEIHLSINATGVVFVDYEGEGLLSDHLILNASNHLSPWGFASVAFFVSPDAWSTYCHDMKAMQGNTYLGSW